MKTFKPSNINAKIHYHDLPGTGTPIIFVHGLGCAGSNDYPQVAASDGLRGRHMLLVDLLGSGFSDRPPDFDYTIAGQAQTVAELIESLGYDKVHLFGHSMGGSIAIEAASLCPSKIDHLVLSEPTLEMGGGVFSRMMIAFSEADYLAHGHAQMVQDSYDQKNDIWATSLSITLPVAFYREARSLIEGSTPTWREKLAALRMPRTVIFSELAMPNADPGRLEQAGINIGIVPNAGHSMAWENPAGLAAAIAQALAT